MSRYYRTPGQRIYRPSGTGPRVVACRRCGAPCRWAAVVLGDGTSRWVLFDAVENPKAAWALDGGLARRTFRAWPGAQFTNHDRHECPEEVPCPPAA